MSQLMFQNALQFRCHAGNALNRDAQLAVVQAAGPGGRFGNIEKLLLSVERDHHVFPWRIVEVACQLLVLLFQGPEQLALESEGCLASSSDVAYQASNDASLGARLSACSK